MILALGSHLISSIGFKEEVTHAKRVRKRQIEYHWSLSGENFERGAREKQREETLVKFPKTGKKRKGTNFETSIPAEWHESRDIRTTLNAADLTTINVGHTVHTT